ncbi:hypothetical protein JCM19239_5757 [Vibrio variabilis]|uniref:Uncharacterized protein n=1 Tax=Vibrio variabilis TaxID=990271 RepID=A0ABQ0JIH7_9VIBR|nr:hypothetical protein JCM19239_5757 [Vibrio variabilis]
MTYFLPAVNSFLVILLDWLNQQTNRSMYPQHSVTFLMRLYYLT